MNPNGVPTSGYPPDAYPFVEVARSLPSFAGIWVDDNQRDYHIALTGDIEGAIAELGAGIPRGITVYFHLREVSYAELDALVGSIFQDRDQLMTKGILVNSGGVGETEGVVFIGMSPFNPEAVRYMQSRYSGPIRYEHGGGSALRPYDMPTSGGVRLAAVRDISDAGLLTCGRRPLAAAALVDEPADITKSGPENAALREALDIYVDVYGDLRGLDWILAATDDYGATFLAERGDVWLEAPVFASKQSWVPGTIDYCSPRPLAAEDGGEAEWSLDPDYPSPTDSSTELQVLVVERACASGGSPAGRIIPPVAHYDAASVTLTIRVRGVGGPATCQGNPALPVTVVLPEPLGDRALEGDVRPRF